MVIRYPHELHQLVQVESTQDENGLFVAVTGAWQPVTHCRGEMDGKGQEVAGIDGVKVKYSANVFLPIACPNILPGTTVKVLFGDVARIQGEVIQFERNQTYCKIWL